MKDDKIEVKINEAVTIDPKEYGLNEEQGKEVESNFLPVEVDKENYAKIYETIVSKEITKETISEARDLRLKLVKVRTRTCDIHKVAKAFYLAGGRFVDALKNKNLTVIEQMEDRLFSIENYYVNIEKERIEKLTADRIELIKPYIDIELINADTLGNMEQPVFDNYFAGLKLTYETKLENERKAEEERLKKIEEEKAEQERIRIENEKLKAEALKKEKELEKIKAKQEVEKKKQDKILADQKAKQELELKKQREESEKKLQLEREAREKIERELKAKQEVEKKRLEEIALKEKQDAENLAKAERQPDKKKLQTLSTYLQAIEMPEVKSKEAKQIIKDVQELLNKVSVFINSKIEKL